MENSLNMNELKHVIQQSVKEAVKQSIHDEMIKFRLSLVKSVSDEEQADIDKLYSSPDNSVADSVEINL